MRKVLLATTALMLLAVPAMAAETEFYGQVNKAISWIDDVNGDRVVVGDNSVSSTRFGFRGEQAVGHGLVASFLLEVEVEDSDKTRTMDTVPLDAPSAGLGGIEERHTRVGLSGDFGSVFLGRTSSATDGITEIDLGGTTDIMYSDVASVGGGLDVNPTGGSDTFNDHHSNLEGFAFGSSDRVNLVRYDSPIFNGFQASTAIANGGDIDVALRYTGEFDGTTVKAGVGYANFNSTFLGDVEQLSGSIAAKHRSGWNIALAYGERDIRNSVLDTQMGYAKVGYDTGNWAFAVDYGTAEDIIAIDREAEAYGIGAQYNFMNGVSVGMLVRQLEIDRATVDTDAARVATFTTRVKF